MRLLHFSSATTPTPRYGVLTSETTLIDATLLLPQFQFPRDIADLQSKVSAAPRVLLDSLSIPLESVVLHCPSPNATKVVCVGLNYAEHATESKLSTSSKPVIFTKTPNTLTGPFASIPIETDKVDYEVELVVVVGKTAKDVSVAQARHYIAGYTVGNDISERGLQLSGNAGQWVLGKCMDSFAPCGPVVVTPEEVPVEEGLEVKTYVNEELLQHSNTRNFIFSIAQVISFVSRHMTLMPGDLIFTGTPAGCGFARNPEIYLKPGDIVRCEIEHIGFVENRIVLPGETPEDQRQLSSLLFKQRVDVETIAGPVAPCFLITGGKGLFGAWISKLLTSENVNVVSIDMKTDDSIIDQVFHDAPTLLSRITYIPGSILDQALLESVVSAYKPIGIIHLAALQIPSVKANPPLGAAVNVTGTLNVFTVARANNIPVVYASSAGVYAPQHAYDAAFEGSTALHSPNTLYGCFKLCVEQCARVFFADYGVSSIGLRPLTVFGVGREVGLTSGPTKAIKAQILNTNYVLKCTGRTGFNYIKDVAEVFVTSARALTGLRLDSTKCDPVKDALVFGIRGEVLEVSEFVAMVNRNGKVTIDANSVVLDEIIACDVLDDELYDFLGTVSKELQCKSPQRTSVEAAVREMCSHFEVLKAKNALPQEDLLY